MLAYIYRSLFIASILFLNINIQAQADRFRLKLRGGEYFPEANTDRVQVQADYLTQTVFGSKHYVVLQFQQLPSFTERQALTAQGIELLEYIPELAYTAILSSGWSSVGIQQAGVRSITYLRPEHKTVPALLQGLAPSHAIAQPGWVDLTILTYERLDRSSIIGSLIPLGAQLIEEMPLFKRFTVRAPIVNMSRIASLPFVQWVEFIDPPNQLENLPGRTLHRVNVLNDGVRNLKGDDINVGIWDGGEVSPHLDFSPAGRRTLMENSSPVDHSTHCAGTICGRGLINPIARGMAPNAKIYSYNFNGNIQSEMATAIPSLGLNVSSHSYGSTQTCGLTGSGVAYSATSVATDINLNNFPYHLHVHSAGNSQSACTGGWSTITSSGKSAKNNILVANITSTEALSTSSSCGPVQDGRVKPEISSMGTSVFSTTTPLNAYTTMSGTSMATPGVAGSVALLVQRYKQLNSNQLPPSALIKNTVLNTARDLGNIGPDYRFGYGRINALQAVRILEENRYRLGTAITGFFYPEEIVVPAGATRLKVMLTWNDPAGTANATPALVNNLDLKVVTSATTYLPWILDPNNPGNPATTGVDNVSNIEQVSIDNPVAGNYSLRVFGTAVTTGSNQPYTLTWTIESPAIEVVYPNGNESLTPGTNEVITWDNAGITSPQTVEYSLDGGANWTTIASNIPAATSRLTWGVPTANTSTALIRVSAGGVIDVSDVTFKILGTVSGFAGNGTSCTPGEINFTWNAVTNANQYDLYRLNDVTGEFDLLVPNISGTTYTAIGLTPNTSYWFTIRAKNSTTNAVSERANAINVTASNGGGGLGAVGSISGNQTICGAQNNVSYSIAAVAGATSYNWTVPTGATIVSGQGTTSIIVNYAAGASSSNISVNASNGTCFTTPATLAITVGSGSISAPLSGGNQSQAVCPGASTPTLVASATVPTGHTLRWYDAVTGGNIVANPSWSTVGTITYYAASVNNLTGCESSTRTPVTLTITSIPAAAITASGPTTFCQGNAVLLAANSGSGYSWSNGATTGSILVSTAGTYTVTVTSNGCMSTSAPVTVTVNPIPSAAVTANGPLAFCAGSSVTLSAPAGNTYSWSNGATTQTISVSNSGTYNVTVTNAFGCTATSVNSSVAVSPNPIVTLTASPYQNLYPGLRTNLNAQVTPTGSYLYTWYKNGVVVSGANTPTLNNIDLGQLGQYTVRVQNQTGLPCSNLSNSVTIGDSVTQRLFILPNPSKGQYEVAYYASGSEQFTLSVYDGRGALAFRRSYAISGAYQRMPVDMRTHASGIYQLILTDRSGKRLANGKVLIR
ncbi:MAG: S8 family serine peptidase [Bacteroidota bacterium]